MARTADVWTKQEVKELCEGIDEVVKNGYQSVEKAVAHIWRFIKARGSRRTIEEVGEKLVDLGRPHKLTAAKLMRNWKEHKGKVTPATNSSPGSSRVSRMSSRQANRTGRGSTGRSSASISSRPATKGNPKMSENVRLQSSQTSPDQAAREPRIGVDEEVAGEENDEEGAEEENGEKASDDVWPASMYAPTEGEIKMIQEWRAFKNKKRYQSVSPEEETEQSFRTILEHIESGVEAFCEAQSVAHLSTSRMTRGVLELARILLPVQLRERAEKALKALSGDGALDISLILRAFSMAAVYKWVLIEFPEIPRLMHGSVEAYLLGAFRDYVPSAAQQFQEAVDIQYLENVVEPTLEYKARHCQCELFDIFVSLRVPLESRFDSPQDQATPSGTNSAHRQDHLDQWQQHMDAAFLEALRLRLSMAKSDGIFSFTMVQQGEKFDQAKMSPLAHIYAKVTRDNLVGLCLRPTITYTPRNPSRREVGQIFPQLKALVTVEGFEVNKTEL
ncbi:hypothetical protein H2200_000964 [Cladophialophora chaetospira]|uniref:Uncharacterized protein n=1 Tax=Cladophialophora chaetospira TaxID=386627 RepID=A0AA39CRH8_9EURO|nr:hypothetical protein H2200_000964 [Cladophialophora chaetospira]